MYIPVLPGFHAFYDWRWKNLDLNYGQNIPSFTVLNLLLCHRWTLNRIKYARSFRAWIGLLLAFSSSLMSIKLQIREVMGGESVWCPFSTHQIPKVGLIRNFPRFYPQYKFVGIIFRKLHVLKTCNCKINCEISCLCCISDIACIGLYGCRVWLGKCFGGCTKKTANVANGYRRPLDKK